MNEKNGFFLLAAVLISITMWAWIYIIAKGLF
jgi:hypothetical protein